MDLRSHVAARLRRWWMPLAVLLLSVTATLLVTVQLRTVSENEIQERFINSIQRREDSIKDRIETYVAMMRAGIGLFAASNYVSREDFHVFVDRLQLPTRYPGIQGLGFTRYVRPHDLADFERRQRATGIEDFHVWPADERDGYHAIVYLEPLDERNRAAIGYDMFTNPTRREAMERARDTAQPAASGHVTLVQEIDEHKQPGFLIYLPLYEGGLTPGTVEERRRQLVGFVYSPFRGHDLFQGIFGRDQRPDVGFAIYDGVEQSPEHLLYRTGDAGDGGRTLSAIRRLNIAGRIWTISFFSTANLHGSSPRVVAIVFLSGLGVSLLLAALSWRQAKAKLNVEHNQAQLREHARTLELLNRAGEAMSGELQLQKLVQAVTDTATELTGAQFGAFFYNLTGPQGEAYTLYTISGVPREKFDQFPMPRNTDIFAPTFRGEQVVRSDDITADPRYGRNAPYHGMPAGHLPVRSYLAVPVISRDDQVLGGLFLGHEQPARFTERHERLMQGIAAQAAIAIDNATLVERLREGEERLRELNANLEERVAQRTTELHDSREKLRLLATRLSAAENHERRRIAYVLHDDFQQMLVAAKMGLSAARSGGALTDDGLDRVDRLISDAIAASRTLAVELFPPVLYDRGLAAGLEWLARHVKDQHHLNVRLTADPAAEPDNRDVQGFLFHSVRELLLNVVKHAGTDEASVTLEHADGATRIIVEDRGRGCDPTALSSTNEDSAGFGLFNIQQRVQLLNGSFEIEAGKTGGCRVSLTVPRSSTRPVLEGSPPASPYRASPRQPDA